MLTHCIIQGIVYYINAKMVNKIKFFNLIFKFLSKFLKKTNNLPAKKNRIKV
jgi:hypothetical protein